MKNIVDLSNQKILRGLLIMIAGIGLLLHTLGIIQTGINLILILVSIGMIIYGIMLSGLQKTVSDTIKNYSPIKKNSKSKK